MHRNALSLRAVTHSITTEKTCSCEMGALRGPTRSCRRSRLLAACHRLIATAARDATTASASQTTVRNPLLGLHSAGPSPRRTIKLCSATSGTELAPVFSSDVTTILTATRCHGCRSVAAQVLERPHPSRPRAAWPVGAQCRCPPASAGAQQYGLVTSSTSGPLVGAPVSHWPQPFPCAQKRVVLMRA